MLGDEMQCGRCCFFFSFSLSFFSPLLLFQLESASQSPPTSAVSHTLYGDSSTSSPAVVCVTRCDLTNQPPQPSDTHTILPSSHPGVMEAFVKQRNVASLQKSESLVHQSLGLFMEKNRGPRSCVELYQRVKLSPNAFSSFPRTVTFFFLFPFFWKDYPIIETHSVCN